MYACMYITAFASIPSNRNRGYFLFRAESHVSAGEAVERKWRLHEFPRLKPICFSEYLNQFLELWNALKPFETL